MNLRIFLQAFVVLLAVSLIGYAFSWIGVNGTVVDSFWKLMALNLGLSIAVAFAAPFIRGIRPGDTLMAVQRKYVNQGDLVQNVMDTFFVTALEKGRVGSKIKVRLANNRRGEGVITALPGTITPASIRLTETEQ